MGVFFAVTFVFWRVAEIITLIPALGMLAYFVNLWVSANALTPTYIVLMFVTVVLATFYAIFTLFSYHRSRRNAVFISFIDLCFMGALIASVYELRFVAQDSCSTITRRPNNKMSIVYNAQGDAEVNGVGVDADRDCSMLKACFALGIMNIVYFFLTSLLVACVGKDKGKERSRSRSRRGSANSRVVMEETTVRRSHSGRSHRSGPGRAYV